MQIEVSHLVKEYKRKKDPGSVGKALASMFHPQYEILRAVDDVNFRIEKGEAVGYVGPNGSGKSTTIKMLSGVLIPTRGKVLINGMEPSKHRMKVNKHVGVVFGNRSVLWWDVPVMESYRVLQQLYEIPEERFRRNLEEFTEILEMESLLGIPERQLSLGQKMKCNIAAAFLHDTEIVYLDEPTIGLDSESKYKIRKFIRRMNEERKTTFLVTSHDFQDIESFCRRIILINHGKLVVDDKIENVRKNFDRRKQIRLELINNPWNEKTTFEIPGVRILYSRESELVLEFDIENNDSIKIINFIAEKAKILDVSINGQDIESIIRDMVKRDNRK
nr:ATP-binding cassette domain-containing protein [uncultured Sellimonas sp.]